MDIDGHHCNDHDERVDNTNEEGTQFGPADIKNRSKQWQSHYSNCYFTYNYSTSE